MADKIEEILGAVAARRRLIFRELFRPESTRPEIICTFLALLELIRLRQVAVTQDQRFGDIYISAVEEPAPTPTEESEAANA